MMNIGNFEKWFRSLNKESIEFQKVYELVHDSYWDFPEHKVDDYIRAAKTLSKLSSAHGLEDMVIATAKIAEQAFLCVNQNIKATHGNIRISGKDYFFDIYTSKSELSSLGKQLRNTIVVHHGVGDDKQ